MQDNPAPELTDDVFNWITTTIPETALVAPPTLLLDTICGKNDHKRVKGSVLTSGGDTSGLEALLGPNYRDVAISQLPSLVRSLRQKAEDVVSESHGATQVMHEAQVVPEQQLSSVMGVVDKESDRKESHPFEPPSAPETTPNEPTGAVDAADSGNADDNSAEASGNWSDYDSDSDSDSIFMRSLATNQNDEMIEIEEPGGFAPEESQVFIPTQTVVALQSVTQHVAPASPNGPHIVPPASLVVAKPVITRTTSPPTTNRSLPQDSHLQSTSVVAATSSLSPMQSITQKPSAPMRPSTRSSAGADLISSLLQASSNTKVPDPPALPTVRGPQTDVPSYKYKLSIANTTDIPGRHYPVEFSKLTQREHQTYCQLMLAPSLITDADSNLLARVDADIFRYRAAEKKWAEVNRPLYDEVVPVIEAFIERMRRQRKAQCTKIYPPHFVTSHEVSLQHGKLVDTSISVEQPLLSVGNPIELSFPTTLPCHVPHNDATCLDEQSTGSKALKWAKTILPPVSEDPNIHTILSQNTVSIDHVLSESALLALLLSYFSVHESPIRIPVSIARGQYRNVITLDKPLPADRWNVRQRAETYYDTMIKSLAANAAQGSRSGSEQENVVYKLVRLGGTTMLIRHKVDGVMNGMPVSILSKMHYLPQPEQFTKTEVATMWLRAALRPSSGVIIAHVRPPRRHVVLFESFDAMSISNLESLPLPSATGPKFDPTSPLSHVASILQQLSSEFSGASTSEKFLISIPPGGAPLIIMRPCEEHTSGAIPLLSATNGVVDRQRIPFVPQRWNHNRVNQIPFTFPPEPLDGKYCFSFAKTGLCASPQHCTYVHLTKAEIAVYPEFCASCNKRAPSMWVDLREELHARKVAKSKQAETSPTGPSPVKPRRKHNKKQGKKRKGETATATEQQHGIQSLGFDQSIVPPPQPKRQATAENNNTL